MSNCYNGYMVNNNIRNAVKKTSGRETLDKTGLLPLVTLVTLVPLVTTNKDDRIRPPINTESGSALKKKCSNRFQNPDLTL